MNALGVKAVDSRGQVFRVPPPDWRLGLVASPERAKMLHTARAAIHGVPSGMGLRLLGGITLGAVFGTLIAYQVRWHMPLDGYLPPTALGLLIGFAAAFGAFRLTDRTPPIASVNPLLSKCRLCIACGYDLANLPSDLDGCTVCPECGVAIRLMQESGLTPTKELGSTH